LAAARVSAEADSARRFRRGIAVAAGGALVFALPSLLTLENWWLGALIDPWRLALLLLLSIPLLTAVSHFTGFEETFGWREDLVDVFAAYAVAFPLAAIALATLSILDRRRTAAEWIGTVALLALGGAIGAMLSRVLFGDPVARSEERRLAKRSGTAGKLFYAGLGALVLSYTLAPTEEIVVIALGMTPWKALVLIAFTLVATHAFALAAERRETPARRHGGATVFWRDAVPAYVVALLVSAFMLWTFGRTDGCGALAILLATVVLGFPAAIGAGGARLIL
jgi:putative integral membrane protein (TIGR02587 family)